MDLQRCITIQVLDFVESGLSEVNFHGLWFAHKIHENYYPSKINTPQ